MDWDRASPVASAFRALVLINMLLLLWSLEPRRLLPLAAVEPRQSVRQSGRQSVRQSGSQAGSQSISQAVKQSGSQAVSQAGSQAVSQSISQSVRRKGQVSVRLGKLGLRRVRISVR